MTYDETNLYLAAILCTLRELCGACSEGHIFASLQVASSTFTLQDYEFIREILIKGKLAVLMPGHMLMLTQAGTALAKQIEEKRLQESAH